ncbi:MAG: MBL fold metallo-hydrolase [Phycisphaerae bacterium]|nr:MBL fold metallo-hydrolase [Phycisphaerae bacterium]
MFLEKVKSEGLAHLSYMVGDGGLAAVIDPRRDVDVYLEIATREGVRIAHVFETHRNEDYLIGSREIQDLTGAEIHHGANLDWGYGDKVSEGESFRIGSARISVLETPGHTFESISYALADGNFGDEPIGVFTGDALFIGDVGRTDFFPNRAKEVAGLQYESIFKKILPLGDDVLLYPAHGAGSVCGSHIASREFSTLGYERRHSQPLQKTDREAFIDMKLQEHHYYPPYFSQMEEWNQQGPAVLGHLPVPAAWSPEEFEQAVEGGATAIDLRSTEAYAGACVPSTISLPLHMLNTFGGWYLPYGEPIALVVEEAAQVGTAVRYLVRMGYDRVAGYLAGGLHAWATSGREYQEVPVVHVDELSRRIKAKDRFTLLDVRSRSEYERGHLPGAVNVYVGQLAENLDEVPRDRPITTFCGSGQRAMIAASILKRNGFEQVENCLGSMAACRAVGCPIVE